MPGIVYCGGTKINEAWRRGFGCIVSVEYSVAQKCYRNQAVREVFLDITPNLRPKR